MGLDIRLPIGGLFTLLGLLLAGYGWVSDPGLYAHSLGINMNLRWGLVMLAFGVIMIVLGRRGARITTQTQQEKGPGPAIPESGKH
jgi:hypothetical protein